MKKLSIVLIGALLLSAQLRADEGMWLLPLLEKLNIKTMNEMGLELSAEDIYSINKSSLKDAIVIFGGGCTGEMVSEEGLLFTNHHCGRGSIFYHSSVGNDYLADGYWAMTRAEELPTPGLGVTFLISIEDVTDKVLKGIKDKMTEAERDEKINNMAEKLEAAATEGTHYRASVRSFFGGNRYYLIVTERYNDVRLVGAPPASIGNFGSDTDNWMWPRHTGDFSIFRVYTGPDGKPAEYSEENVPMKPKHYLPVSIRGVEKDDFAMILGYPGGTQRFMTSWEIDEVQEITHPNRISIRGARLDIMKEDMIADPVVMTKYRAKASGASNYWKFSIGQSAGLERLEIKSQKQALEDEFTGWISQDKKLSKRYGEALESIQGAVEGRKEYRHATQYLSETLLRGSEIIGFAGRARPLYRALASTDLDEKKRIKQALERFSGGVEGFYKNYNPPTDKKITRVMLEMAYNNLDRRFYPDYLVTLHEKFDGDFEKAVDEIFNTSMFNDPAQLDQFLTKPTLEALENDPVFKLARSVYDKYNELNEKTAAYQEDYSRGHRLFVDGVMQMKEESKFYPDANFTMRLTYGRVADYYPRDAVKYLHYTTLQGVMEKDIPGNYEFDVDERLKKLHEVKDYGRYDNEGMMPVCFTTNNDITGGNSGSPVINGRGELIGLAFDGNWEAMTGDIAFEPDLQRCINVDIRYVLFIIEKFAGATHIIEELDLRR